MTPSERDRERAEEWVRMNTDLLDANISLDAIHNSLTNQFIALRIEVFAATREAAARVADKLFGGIAWEYGGDVEAAIRAIKLGDVVREEGK